MAYEQLRQCARDGGFFRVSEPISGAPVEVVAPLTIFGAAKCKLPPLRVRGASLTLYDCEGQSVQAVNSTIDMHDSRMVTCAATGGAVTLLRSGVDLMSTRCCDVFTCPCSVVKDLAAQDSTVLRLDSTQ